MVKRASLTPAVEIRRVPESELHRADATEKAIERYAPDITIPPPAVFDQARRNLDLRIAMLQEFGAATPEEVAECVHSSAKRPTTVVDNWKRYDRVVAVRWRGRTLVPGFQLQPDGTPIPELQPILRVLREYGMGEWERALWWVIANASLDQQRPVDLLPHIQEPQVAELLMAAAPRRREWF